MTLLRNTEFIAFDLETTGLHPAGSQIVEIGAVRFRGDGTVLAQFQQLIDPGCPIPRHATAVHGISDRDVQGQPTIREALQRFLEFVRQAPSIMMAHNAAFDLGFLSFALGRLREPCPDAPVVDTLRLSRHRLPLPNHKLETIGRHLQLIDDEEHRALADTLLLKDVFLHLIGRRPAIQSVAQLFEVCPAWSFEARGALVDRPPAGFEDLWRAIGSQQPLTLVYDGGNQPGVARVVTPLGVVRTRGQLYLSALCHASGIEKTFRLDKIVSYRRKS
ncbi:MAG: exonuclease domain-containing protein [Pirellulales bacterium]